MATDGITIDTVPSPITSSPICPGISKLVISVDDRDWDYIEGQEGRDDVMRWKTLMGGGGISTSGISMGIFEIPPGEQLSVHHHAPQEVYHIIRGSAEVLIGDERRQVGAGHAIYIPPNVSHGIKNTGAELLELIWMFPTDNWKEIVYHMEGREL